MTPEMIAICGLGFTILCAMLHANARFASLETKVELLYKSFQNGIFNPYSIRGKSHGD